ncbi:MAG: UDP-N-acetylmuramoyl-L-alanyl-D-glutamate--2,6-diaminopimelate ligase [Chlamydiales bacterium]|nr:UDP-N-acetylmuramoyl-L-alanyl-D-glutamate--2,6-diaminopimelate ligase [Chlamydiales bacterium]
MEQPMNLKHLISGLPVELYKGGRDIPITGLCSHSKLVAPGNLFIAKKGTVDDGAKYIEEALASGAAAILTDLPNPFLKEVVQIIAADVSAVESEIAARYYGNPSQELFMVGVTGTNGKTTISYLVKHIFDACGLSCGMIGTIEYIIGRHHFAAQLTTPEIITNQKLLKEMVKQKCSTAVMEVSSIGLDQGRVAKIDYDAAIFTNLSQEHLDYHKTMEAYAEAKAKLFQELKPAGIAILNADSPWSARMRKDCSARLLTYGFDAHADLFAHSIELMPDQTRFCVTYQGRTLPFAWRLIGRFNVYNSLAAIGTALTKGIPFEALPEIIAHFPSVRGRLEPVENLNGFHIYVDYAHTPDALEKALLSLYEVKRGRILTLFGGGGNRDRTKRPQMAKAVEKYSDFAFVTSDNPRNEDPLSICEEIAQGFKKSNFLIEVDRRSAIERAIEMANPEDLILIAGKGHETYQIFAHQTLPFDDRQIAQEIANRVSV